MGDVNEKILCDLARAIDYGCGSSHILKLFTKWNKIVGYNMLSTASLIGRGTIANNRREKRKARKFGGRWVERKLHRHKNGRDNLYYVWREWWEN